MFLVCQDPIKFNLSGRALMAVTSSMLLRKGKRETILLCERKVKAIMRKREAEKREVNMGSSKYYGWVDEMVYRLRTFERTHTYLNNLQNKNK